MKAKKAKSRSIREVRSQSKLLPPKLKTQTDGYRKSQYARAETSAATSTRTGKPAL